LELGREKTGQKLGTKTPGKASPEGAPVLQRETESKKLLLVRKRKKKKKLAEKKKKVAGQKGRGELSFPLVDAEKKVNRSRAE